MFDFSIKIGLLLASKPTPARPGSEIPTRAGLGPAGQGAQETQGEPRGPQGAHGARGAPSGAEVHGNIKHSV